MFYLAAPTAQAGGRRPAAAVLFADQALFDLLARTWRTGADLVGVLPDILVYLHTLADILTRPAGDPGPDAVDTGEETLLGSDPVAVHAGLPARTRRSSGLYPAGCPATSWT